jgi:F0F1-type ATP synthase assembly protein I
VAAPPWEPVKQDWKGVGRYGTVGLELVLSVLLGLFGGQFLDKRFHTSPWLTLIGLAYGVAAGVRGLYRAAARATREAEELDRREREERKKFRDPDERRRRTPK